MKEQIDFQEDFFKAFDDILIEFDEMGFVPTNHPHDHNSEYYAIDWKNRLINALEGYRKQSENVVELPCKIGDKVYSVGRNPNTYEWLIREQSIYSIAIYSTGIHLYISPIIDFHISAIGTRYFFSREDAEKALAKMKGGD